MKIRDTDRSRGSLRRVFATWPVALITAAFLILPSLVVPSADADTREVYEYTNSALYDILQPSLIEVVPTSPPDPPNGYAQLILQAQSIYRTEITNYFGAASSSLVSFGPRAGLRVAGSPGSYSPQAVFTSRVLDKGASGFWSILNYMTPSDDTTMNNVAGQMTTGEYPGMKAFYRMDDDAWLDRVTMNTGTPDGSPVFAADAPFGANSGEFDGASKIEMYNSTTLLNTATAATMSCWIKLRGWTSLGGIIGHLSPKYLGLSQSPLGTDGIWFYKQIGASTYSACESTMTFELDRWYFLVGTWHSGDGIPRMYVDGKLEAEGSPPSFAPIEQSSSAWIGWMPAGGAARKFDGWIDEVAIWDRALTLAQIRMIYESSKRSIRFQIRSGTTPTLSGDFVGLDNTTNTFYHGIGEKLSSGTNFMASDRYAQYRAYLMSDAYGNTTPTMDAVMMCTSNGVALFDNTYGDLISGDITDVDLVVEAPYGRARFVGLAKQANGGYYTNGVYTSRILDGGDTNASWSKVSWDMGEELSSSLPGLVGLWHAEDDWDSAVGPNGVPANDTFTEFAKAGDYSAVFNGVNTTVTISGLDVRSLEFWIEDENVNDGVLRIVDGAANTTSILIENRALAVDCPIDQVVKTFVNGNSASMRMLPGWNHVAVVFEEPLMNTVITVGVAGGDPMLGKMDELAVYASAISRQVVQAHYTACRRTVAGRAVRAQARSGNTMAELEAKSFTKPGGTAAQYLQNGELFSILDQRYFQYAIHLNGDGNATPGLRSVTVQANPTTQVDDSSTDFAAYVYDDDSVAWYGDEIALHELHARGPVNMDALTVPSTEALWHMDEDTWQGPPPQVKDEKELKDGDRYGGADTIAPAGVGANCGNFNGADAYVDLPGVNLSSDDFSIGFWFKTTSTGKAPIISTDDGSGECYTVEINGNGAGGVAEGKVAFRIEDNSSAVAVVSARNHLNDGVWHDVVAVRDGSYVHLYIDGNREGTASIGAFGNVDGKNVFVGTDGTQSAFFSGQVDELGIWSRVLTREEIAEFSSAGFRVEGVGEYESETFDAGDQAIWQEISWVADAPYSKPLSTEDLSLTGLWRMEDGAGATITNSVALNDGSINGASFSANGRFGRCLEFGAGDYVSIGDAAALEPAMITVEAWINADDIRACTIIDKRAGGQGYRLSLSASGVPALQVGGTTINGFESIQTGRWTHVAGSYDASVGLKLYVNGEVAATSGAGGETVGSTAAAWLASDVGGGNDFYGRIDEVAIHDRALGYEELFDHYRAGAVTLKFQAKSSISDPAVPGPFLGPGQVAGTYFTYFPGDDMQGDIPLGRYFRFKAYLDTEDLRLTPRLYGVRVFVANFPAGNPTVAPIEAEGKPFPGRLIAFGDSRAPREPGDSTTTTRYQISGDSGGTPRWFHWDTSGATNKWADAIGLFPQYNYASSRAAISNNIASFYDDFYNETGGLFRVRAFLHSDGAYQMKLDHTEIIRSDGRLVVTVPNGVEVGDDAWLTGVDNTIRWTRAGTVIGTVRIDYTLDGGTNWVNITNGLAAAADQVVWQTPGTISDNCFVRISNEVDRTIFDVSNDPFELVWKYRMVDHNGGPPVWFIGETNTIVWASASGLGNGRLAFSGDGTWVSPYNINFATPLRTYQWYVPTTNADLVSETAKLRISSPGVGASTLDYSDNFFVMAGAVIVDPAPGSKVKKDAIYNVNFKTAGCGTNVMIEFQSVSGGPWSVVDASVPCITGMNSYAWMVTNQPTEEARLRITSLSEPRAKGMSLSFIIAAIEIVRPVGDPDPNQSDKWLNGSTQAITWASAGASAFVNIDFSTNSGVSWLPIAANYPNSNVAGEINTNMWTVPAYPSPNARIRVQDTGDPSNLFSISTFDFHIAGVTVLFPNGPYPPQEWVKDAPQQITWENDAVGNNCIVEFSYDGGLIWTNIMPGGAALAFPDKASPPFSPTTPTVRGLVRITAEDPSDPVTGDPSFTNIFDVSDNWFAVAGIRVDAPVGGVEYTIGTTNPITFLAAATHAFGLSDVYYAADGVNFDTNNSVKANLIFDEVFPGMNNFNWVVEATREPSENARIRVQAAGYYHDSELFTVRGLRFNVPDAATVWGPGLKNVQWKVAGLASDCAGDVYLSTEGYNPASFTNQVNPFQVTLDEGGGNGGFPWTIPAGMEPTANAVLKLVVVTSVVNVADIGFEAFSQPFTLRGVKMLSPISTDIWYLGGTYDIQWKAAAAGVSAYLYYSADGGTNYDSTPVAQAIASADGTNTFSWTVEMSRMPTAGAMLRIDMSGGLSAESQVFRMEGIQIIKPTSSDIYATTDSTNMILWVDVGDGGPYTLSFITNYPNAANPMAVVPGGTYDYNWNIPSNAINTSVVIRVAGTTYTNESQIFQVVGKPTISIVSPAPDAYWGVGATRTIEWSRGGKMDNDFTVRYSLDPYTVSNAIFGVVSFNSTNNIYSLNWMVPDQLMQARISVQHNTKPDVNDVTSPFNICGRFQVWSPVGGETLYALAPESVSWQTIGSVTFVDLYYSITPPYTAGSWVKINSSPIANNYNTDLTPSLTPWSWSAADVQTVDAKFRVQEAQYTNVLDEGIEGAYDSSGNAFEIKYYSVFWDVFHVDENGVTGRLDRLSVSDNSGWSESGLTCLAPGGGTVFIPKTYPYGIYDTQWYREFFHDTVDFHWVCDVDNAIRQVEMTKSEIEPDYHVMADFTYDEVTNTFTIVSWLERSGAILDTPDTCTIEIYDKNGDILETLVSSTDKVGVFWQAWDVTATEAALIASGDLGAEGFAQGTVFFARVSITFSGATYSSGLTFILRQAPGPEINYGVVVQTLYNRAAHEVTIRSWLERDGAIFAATKSTVDIVDLNGTNIHTMVSTNSQSGVYWQTWDVGPTETALIGSGYLSTNGFEGNYVLLAVVNIESFGDTYSSAETLTLEESASEEDVYEVQASFSYNQSVSNVAMRSWLESKGVLVDTTNSVCTVRIFDKNGAQVATISTNVAIGDIFLLNWSVAGLGYSAGDSFFARIEIVTPLGTFSAGETFVLSETGDMDAVIQAIWDSNTNLVDHIDAVATNLTAIGGRMDSRLTNLIDIAKLTRADIGMLSTNMSFLTNEMINVIGPTLSNIYADVTTMVADMGIDSARILDRWSSVGYGTTNSILYRSRAGYGAAVTITVSNQVQGLRYAGTMSEIVAGLYQHDLVADWGTNSYIVTCSDPYPASDSIVLEVVGEGSDSLPALVSSIDSKMDALATQVAAIEDLVAGLGGADLGPVITGIEEIQAAIGSFAETDEEIDLTALTRIEEQLGSGGTIAAIAAKLGAVTDTSSSETFFGQLVSIQENLTVAGASAESASKKAQTAKTEAAKAASGIDELKSAVAEGKMETATMKMKLDKIQTALVAAEASMREIPKAVRLAGLYDRLEDMADTIEKLAKSKGYQEWVGEIPEPAEGGGADEASIAALIGGMSEMEASMAFLIKVTDEMRNKPIVEETFIGVE